MELNFKKKKIEEVTSKEASSPKNDFDKYSKYGKYNSLNASQTDKSNNDLIEYDDSKTKKDTEKVKVSKEKEEKVEIFDQDEYTNTTSHDYQKNSKSNTEDDDDLDKYFNDYINKKSNDKEPNEKKENISLNTILIIVISILVIFIIFILLIDKKRYTLTIINNKEVIKSLSCNSYKIFSYESGCEVTLPLLTENGKYDLGYSVDENLTIENKANDVIELKDSKLLYAIIGEKIITVKFVATEAEYIEYDQKQCLVPKGKKSCEIKIPYIDKAGEYRLSFNSKKNQTINSYKDTSNLYYLDKTYKFDKDTTLYETIEAFAERSYSIYRKYKINESYIEIDAACTQEQKDQIEVLLNNVKNTAPFLLNIKGKITFLSHNNFYETWIRKNNIGYGAVGITTMAKNLNTAKIANIDVDCQYVNTATVHEMIHRYDYNYALAKGNYLSSSNELISLFRTYSTQYMYYRYPFRQYAYTDQKEFLAEAYNYYYFTYKNYDAAYAQSNYPSDVKAFIEKNIK